MHQSFGTPLGYFFILFIYLFSFLTHRACLECNFLNNIKFAKFRNIFDMITNNINKK